MGSIGLKIGKISGVSKVWFMVQTYRRSYRREYTELFLGIFYEIKETLYGIRNTIELTIEGTQGNWELRSTVSCIILLYKHTVQALQYTLRYGYTVEIKGHTIKVSERDLGSLRYEGISLGYKHTVEVERTQKIQEKSGNPTRLPENQEKGKTSPNLSREHRHYHENNTKPKFLNRPTFRYCLNYSYNYNASMKSTYDATTHVYIGEGCYRGLAQKNITCACPTATISTQHTINGHNQDTKISS